LLGAIGIMACVHRAPPPLRSPLPHASLGGLVVSMKRVLYSLDHHHHHHRHHHHRLQAGWRQTMRLMKTVLGVADNAPNLRKAAANADCCAHAGSEACSVRHSEGCLQGGRRKLGNCCWYFAVVSVPVGVVEERAVKGCPP
jgi:hypothetical protein